MVVIGSTEEAEFNPAPDAGSKSARISPETTPLRRVTPSLELAVPLRGMEL
jgi:hypothetical protein